MFDPETLTLAQSVLDACRARGWHVATAESCTGGLVAAALTAIAGSSDVVERGFVTYSNAAKSELLGVPPETIAAHGAVSAETAAAMAEGALARAPIDLAVSISRRRRSGWRQPREAGRALSISAWRGVARSPAPNAISSPAIVRRCATRPCGMALGLLAAEACKSLIRRHTP